MTDSTAAPAELIAGKYRLTRLLGRGGMGSVWEGVHVSLGTRVACKFIEAEYAGSKEARDRFDNEAMAAAALRSKYVVEVYDHGVTSDGRPYIVMEFLQGEPLDSRIEGRGALSVAETASILQQVARALSKAHAVGIVHRDLKPENVFLVWDDDDQADIAKVVDFGIAKFTDETLGISSQTRTGSILGTPYYMSPEQARGLRTVDARSDLWSLGVIAFQCMTGQLPFGGEALGDLLVKICTGEPAQPSSVRPELGPEVDAWVARALAREPDQRFQSAREMADALSVIAGQPVRALQNSTIASEAVDHGRTQPNVLSSTAGALTNSALAKSTPAPGALPSRGVVMGALAATVVGLSVVGWLALGGREQAHDVTAETGSAAVAEEQAAELAGAESSVEPGSEAGRNEPEQIVSAAKKADLQDKEAAPQPPPPAPSPPPPPPKPPPPKPPPLKPVKAQPKEPAAAPRKPAPVDLGY